MGVPAFIGMDKGAVLLVVENKAEAVVPLLQHNGDDRREADDVPVDVIKQTRSKNPCCSSLARTIMVTFTKVPNRD